MPAHYKILASTASSTGIANLENMVTQYLNDGWLLAGGVSLCTDRFSQVTAVQAIIKPDSARLIKLSEERANAEAIANEPDIA